MKILDFFAQHRNHNNIAGVNTDLEQTPHVIYYKHKHKTS